MLFGFDDNIATVWGKNFDICVSFVFSVFLYINESLSRFDINLSKIMDSCVK